MNEINDLINTLSNKNVLSKPAGGMLQLRKQDECYLSKALAPDYEYQKLKLVHDFQKKAVRKNMHRAMSPISAISGYLELIRMLLMKDVDVDVEKIERYRTKIDEGVSELSEIIEELYEAFNEEGAKVRECTSTVTLVNMNQYAG